MGWRKSIGHRLTVLAPVLDKRSQMTVAPISVIRPRTAPCDHRVAEDHLVDPFGIAGGKYLGDEAALGNGQQVGSLEPRCVHDRENVGYPLIDRLAFLSPLRQPHASLVESGQADVFRK